MRAFHLYIESWIEVMPLEGDSRHVGMLELLLNGDQYGDLANENSLTDFAVLRTLLAFVHRAYDNRFTLDEWKKAWKNRSLDRDRIQAYADRWYDRFWLLDDKAPFYQTLGLKPSTKDGEIGSCDSIMLFHNEKKPYLTNRHSSSLDRVSFAEAARNIVTIQAYDISGIKTAMVGDGNTQGKSYGIGVSQMGEMSAFAPAGNTFFETLMLNLVPSDIGKVEYPSDDLPAWEKAPSTVRKTVIVGDKRQSPMYIPTGPIDLYTLQNRRLLIYSEDGVHATHSLLTNGFRVEANLLVGTETHAIYMRNQKGEFHPLKPKKRSRLTRTKAALSPPSVAKDSKKSIVQTVAESSLRSVIGYDYDIRYKEFGMEYPDDMSASTGEVVDNSLIIPSAALDDDLALTVQAGLDSISLAVDEYVKFYSIIAAANGHTTKSSNSKDSGSKDDKKAKNSHREFATRSIEFRLEPQFKEWLSDISSFESSDHALDILHRKILDAVIALSDEDIIRLPRGMWSRIGKAETDINPFMAQKRLKGIIRQALSIPSATEEKK